MNNLVHSFGKQPPIKTSNVKAWLIFDIKITLFQTSKLNSKVLQISWKPMIYSFNIILGSSISTILCCKLTVKIFPKWYKRIWCDKYISPRLREQSIVHWLDKWRTNCGQWRFTSLKLERVNTKLYRHSCFCQFFPPGNFCLKEMTIFLNVIVRND